MLPPDWQRDLGKMPTLRDRHDYLLEVVTQVEEALHQDKTTATALQTALGLYPRVARVAAVLYRSRNEVVSRERLLFAIDPEYASDVNLRVAVHSLRGKLRPLGASVISHTGVGYQLLDCPDLLPPHPKEKRP